MATLPDTRPRAIGSLKVQLVRAILPKMDMFGATGESDPFVVLSMNTQTFKTDKQKRTRTPKWDLEFRFDVNSEKDTLKVQCFDWDRFSKNDLIGEADVPVFADLIGGALEQDADAPEVPTPTGPVDFWVDLQKAGKKTDTRGRILLKFEYLSLEEKATKDFSKSKDRRGSIFSNSVFVENRSGAGAGSGEATPEVPPTPRNSLASKLSPKSEENFANQLSKLKEKPFDTSDVDAKGRASNKEEKRREEGEQGDAKARKTNPVEAACKIRSNLDKKLKEVRQRPLNLDSSSDEGSDLEEFDSAEEVDVEISSDDTEESQLHKRVMLKRRDSMSPLAYKKAQSKLDALVLEKMKAKQKSRKARAKARGESIIMHELRILAYEATCADVPAIVRSPRFISGVAVIAAASLAIWWRRSTSARLPGPAATK